VEGWKGEFSRINSFQEPLLRQNRQGLSILFSALAMAPGAGDGAGERAAAREQAFTFLRSLPQIRNTSDSQWPLRRGSSGKPQHTPHWQPPPPQPMPGVTSLARVAGSICLLSVVGLTT
jgi:hypothetical protein